MSEVRVTLSAGSAHTHESPRVCRKHVALLVASAFGIVSMAWRRRRRKGSEEREDVNMVMGRRKMMYFSASYRGAPAFPGVSLVYKALSPADVAATAAFAWRVTGSASAAANSAQATAA